MDRSQSYGKVKLRLTSLKLHGRVWFDYIDLTWCRNQPRVSFDQMSDSTTWLIQPCVWFDHVSDLTTCLIRRRVWFTHMSDMTHISDSTTCLIWHTCLIRPCVCFETYVWFDHVSDLTTCMIRPCVCFETHVWFDNMSDLTHMSDTTTIRPRVRMFFWKISNCYVIYKKI